MIKNVITMDDLLELENGDILKAGDLCFDDMGEPVFRLGSNHPRIGTEYEEGLDMVMYRDKE